jgi:ABC-type uncharacterized transport system auxiliary subunit
MKHRPGALLAFIALAGCVFRQSDPPRYFRPDAAALSSESTPDDGSAKKAIRLRAVRARPFLRERIVWRTPTEYGMYEQRRWSELPEAYVERALVSALRRQARVDLTNDPRAPRLYANVTAFDEVVDPKHVANVAVDVTLTAADGSLLLDRGFSAEAPIADDDPNSLVRAVGAALDDVSAQVAQSVAEKLKGLKPLAANSGGR